MENPELVGSQWRYVLAMLPDDLNVSPEAKLTIQRRREVEDASDLLRLVLAYSVCDFSLRETAVWAEAINIGRLSHVAVRNHLQKAADWMGYLVLRWLQDHGVQTSVAPVAVRLIDASVVCKPGSKGTDWRVHMRLDLASERISGVELTDGHGGETLRRHDIAKEEIVVADRGYGYRTGAAHVIDAGGHVVLRIGSNAFPLKTPQGAAVGLLERAGLLAPGEIGDWPVRFECDGVEHDGRLIILHKSAPATEHETKRVLHESRSKGRETAPDTVEAAAYIFVFTDLPETTLTAVQVLELYRLRWQVEIAFKRLKSLLHLDRLRAKTPELSKTYLYGKLLAALIIDEMYAIAESFFPWGYPLLCAPPVPRPYLQAHA